jgi:hypothetical protein
VGSMSEAPSFPRLSVCCLSPGVIRYLFGRLLRRQNVCRDVSTPLAYDIDVDNADTEPLLCRRASDAVAIEKRATCVNYARDLCCPLCRTMPDRAATKPACPYGLLSGSILCLRQEVYDIPIVPVWNFLYKHTPHETPNITHYHNQKCKQKL